MKRKSLIATVLICALVGTGLWAKKNGEKQGPEKERTVKVTIMEDRNGNIEQSSETITVKSREDLHEYLKGKGYNPEEMEVFKQPMKHHMAQSNVWIMGDVEHLKKGGKHKMVFIESEETEDVTIDDDGNKQVKVIVKTIDKEEDGEGKSETKSYRVEKEVDKDGNVTVKKYVDGKEVDPDTPMPRHRARHRISEEGEDVIIEVDKNGEKKTIEIKKTIDDEGNMKVIKTVNGKEVTEEDCHHKVRWHEGARPGMSKTILRSKDGQTTIFVEPVMDDVAKQKRTNTELNDLDLDQVEFSPNPSDGKFTLEFSTEDKGAISVEVVDMNGKSVLKQKDDFEGGTYRQTFDIENAERGMYVVRIGQNGKSYTHRLLIH